MKKLVILILAFACTYGYSQKRFKDGLIVEDSVFLSYLMDAENNYQWLGLSPTGAIYSDSLSNAGFMLRMELPNSYMEDYLLDTVKGEIKWYYTDSMGNIVYSYGLEDVPLGKQLQSLMASTEMDKRYISKLETRVNLLLIGLIISYILTLAIIYMTIKK